MTIAPETLAQAFLEARYIQEKTENSLFLKDVAVVVFDGMILWQGNLNMERAIPCLRLLSKSLGLPVAIIEKEILNKKKKKKKRKNGSHCGPGLWIQNSWSTYEGFDFGLKESYNENGRKRETEKKQNSDTDQPTEQGNSKYTSRGWEEWMDENNLCHWH